MPPEFRPLPLEVFLCGFPMPDEIAKLYDYVQNYIPSDPGVG